MMSGWRRILFPGSSFAAGGLPEHEVGMLIDGGRPAGMHQRAGIVLLDDRRTGDDVAATELGAIEDDRRAPAVGLREPHVASILDRRRRIVAALGQRRPLG